MDDGPGALVRSSIYDPGSAQPNRDPETFPTEAPTTLLPWSIDHAPAAEFGERTECMSFRGGSIRRVRLATDTPAQASSSADAHTMPACLYANFVVAGEVEVGHGSDVSVARAGDVILYVSPLRVTLRRCPTPYYEDVSFAISKNEFASIGKLDDVFDTVTVLRRDSLLPPLASSLSFLAGNMSSLSRTEVAALFNACVSLLPVAVAHSNRNKIRELATPKASHLLSALLDYVNEHVSSADLSPQVAALNVGISVRYVHKLFAARNTTFASYVTMKRLELVGRELASPLSRNQAISTVGYRCGFNDLSTFNRSFKRHYGVTPRKFRADASAAPVLGHTVTRVLAGSNVSKPPTAGREASELEHVTR